MLLHSTSSPLPQRLADRLMHIPSGRRWTVLRTNSVCALRVTTSSAPPLSLLLWFSSLASTPQSLSCFISHQKYELITIGPSSPYPVSPQVSFRVTRATRSRITSYSQNHKQLPQRRFYLYHGAGEVWLPLPYFPPNNRRRERDLTKPKHHPSPQQLSH